MVTIPSFSKPKSRKEFDNTRVFLTKFFETNENLSKNEASRIASMVLTFTNQGLTNAQIQKNLADDRAFRDEKAEEKKEELEKLKQTEKQKLRQKQINEAKARSEKLSKNIRKSKERSSQEVRDLLNSKKDEPKVPNPNNPRELIPKSQADKILQQRRNSGKSTAQDSRAQKNNPSILESIKQKLFAQKDESKAEVVAVNRSLVLLSNGKSIPRNEFKGKIPEKFLNTQRTKQPENNITDIKDLERNKAVIKSPKLTSIQSPIKTENTASISQDLSKSPKPNLGGKKGKSAFKKDTDTPTLGDGIKTITDAIEDFTESITNPTPEAKAEDGKKTEPLDPLKPVADFFGSIFNQKPKETKPAETPKPEPTKTEKPAEPKPEDTTPVPTKQESNGKIEKAKTFLADNSFAIAGTAISLMSLIAFLAVPRDVRTEISRRG